MIVSQTGKGENVLPFMVNTKHDADTYEWDCCKREIYDGNVLYEAYVKARKGSSWKPQVQRFSMLYLLELSAMQKDLRDRTYEFLPYSNFVINERGKARAITGEQIRDRIMKHALCDEAIFPAIEKYLIYDNGASVKGKGINFTRGRLEKHLHNFFMKNGSNEGYIMLIDFSKYYDNIRHDKLMEIFRKYIKDDTALWILQKTIDRSKVDVSYMTDEEYEKCLDTLFNSLEYQKIAPELKTGEKYMHKHLNIGDQVAQDAGIVYPSRIDNYIKIVRGVKYYGRYMDDSYVIHKDREYLKQLEADIIQIAKELGITVNVKKTRICKLSETWKFLQIRYSLTATGRVVKRANVKRLTAFRRKMKKLAGVISQEDFDNWYESWFKGHYKIMSRLQRENFDSLYKSLKEERYGKTDSCRRNGAGGPAVKRQQCGKQKENQ